MKWAKVPPLSYAQQRSFFWTPEIVTNLCVICKDFFALFLGQSSPKTSPHGKQKQSYQSGTECRLNNRNDSAYIGMAERSAALKRESEKTYVKCFQVVFAICERLIVPRKS